MGKLEDSILVGISRPVDGWANRNGYTLIKHHLKQVKKSDEYADVRYALLGTVTSRAWKYGQLDKPRTSCTEGHSEH